MKLIETTRDAMAPERRFHTAAAPTLQLDEAALNRLRELDPSGKTRLVERVFEAFEASMQRMLPQLLAGLPEGADTLGSAAAAAQVRGLRLIAHTLKSSAATVGASAMARQCTELEVLLRDGRTDGIDGRISALLTEMVRVRLAMRALTDRPA